MHDVPAAILVGITTDCIFYGVDSYKVMIQGGGKGNVRNVFKGIGPVVLTGSGPTFGAFFSLYGPLKHHIGFTFPRMDESVGVLLASSCAGAVSSILGVPSDVVKKRLIIISDVKKETFSSISKEIMQKEGIKGFFLGWRANMIKDVPFAGLKMSLYEALKRLLYGNKELTTTDSGLVGFTSGVLTGILTCPLGKELSKHEQSFDDVFAYILKSTL